MTKAAIISGSLVDVRNIAAHKCVRLEIHVPVEYAPKVMEAFGWPTMVDPVTVAIARLAPDALPAPPPPAQAEKPRQKWENLPLPQQAAMRCAEAPFRRFLVERYDALDSEESAAECVREMCGVKSRADIGKSEYSRRQWQEVDRDYQFWLRNA